MNASTWINERVNKLRPAAPAAPARRSVAERIKARLRQGDEALSPRALRQRLDDIQAVVDPMVSEVEGGRRAQVLMDWYTRAEAAERRDLWRLLSELFKADPDKVRKAQAELAAAAGTPDEAAAEVLYRRATVSPRRRLLQRFSVYPGGVQFLARKKVV